MRLFYFNDIVNVCSITLELKWKVSNSFFDEEWSFFSRENNSMPKVDRGW